MPRFLRVPQDRVAVVKGQDHETVARIENNTDTDITVESNGDVEITGDNALDVLQARDIVKAIGRGFTPDKAMQLTDDTIILQIIHVNEYASTDNSKERLKGRVIGRNGKTRETIEDETQTDLCVYGKTVGIIGEPEHVELAARAVTQLLQGREHATVYNNLHEQAEKLRMKTVT